MRAQDWPVRLAEAIEDAGLRPFAWGSHDCATWAFTVAARLRDEPAPDWGTYRTERGAMMKLRRAGIRLPDLGTAILGDPLPGPLFAQRGDVVFTRTAYGICIGTHIAHVGPEGLTTSDMSAAVTAWRV